MQPGRGFGRGRAFVVLGALAACAAGSFVTSDAAAQDLPLRTPRILPPGRPLAGTDDSDALALNPAQIAFSPSWEFRYTHVEIPTSASAVFPSRGDAVRFATPIAFGLATGVSFESIRPPSRAPIGSLQVFGWSIALQMGEALAYSIDLRHYRPNTEGLNSGTTFGLSYALRPSPFLGIAFIARDLTASKGDVLAPGVGIDRSFDLGIDVRPFGVRSLELGLEGGVMPSSEAEHKWSTRGVIGIDLPLARLQASFDVVDPASFKQAWSITAGLDLGVGHVRAGGGVIAGPGLDAKGPGWYATASLAGYKQAPTLEMAHAVKIRIEDTPGARGHVKLLRKLARLGRDPRTRAVVFVMKTDPAASTAHAEELADAISALQAKGIKVLCHFEDMGGRGLLACSTANKILLQPAGGARFAGLRTQTMYFGEALHKIGIEPDFLRIKEHKSAPEAFVRDGPTPVSAQDSKEFLAGVEAIYLNRLAKGRRLPVDVVKKNIANGPFVADEAIANGFADAKAFDDEVDGWVRKELGYALPVDPDEPDDMAPKSFGQSPRIAVIYLDGDIVDGRSQHIPILGTRLAGSYTIADALEKARNDPSIKGVVLRIESPGGSSLASDVMWREAELLAKRKPVVVSMGSVAASGGYYAASFGAPIYANASTVTGSIGIFYGKADVSPLLKKLGINVVTEKTAPKADAESLYRPFTPEERVELGKKVAQFYAVFLDRVARGRGWTVEQVDSVGHGKVWLGSQAKKVGLVDEVAGFDVALDVVRRRCGLPPDAPIVELPKESGGLLDLVLDYLGADAPPQVAALPKAIAAYVDAIAPFAVYGADQPLALYEGLGAP